MASISEVQGWANDYVEKCDNADVRRAFIAGYLNAIEHVCMNTPQGPGIICRGVDEDTVRSILQATRD